MSELEEKFEILKNEVDALQIALMNQNATWFKNIPLWVSILALLFSFGTTVVSYQRAESQNNQALKSELRVVLQRLSQLPSEQFEKKKEHEGDENAIAFFASQANQEGTLLAKQSASIAKKIPPELITSIEYASIAVALQNSYQIDEALTYLSMAKLKVEGMNDEVSVLRGIANLKFISGQPEQGRTEYQEALSVFSKYQGHNEYTIKSTHVWTYRYWAYAEAGIGRLDLANQKLEQAMKLTSTIMISPGRSQLEGQIQQTWHELNNNGKSSTSKNEK